MPVISSVDVSALSDFINDHQQDIAMEYLIGAEFAEQVTLDLNVSNKKAYEKLVVTSGLKPYDGVHNPEANKITYSERVITVEVLQDDYSFNPEAFRKKFFGDGANITGGENPRMQEQLSAIMKKNVSILNNEIVYGASTARPNTDPARLRQVDGYGKQITDLIADSNSGIIVKATGTLTTGTGWGGSSTVWGNIIEKIDLMDEGTSLQVANEPRLAYMSYGTFNKYVQEYRNRWPLGNLFTQINGITGVYTETSKGLLKLEPCRWMGTSNRVFITPKKNMVFGTDIQSPDFSVFSTIPGVYKLDMGFKMVYGMLVVDPAAMVVNELA